MLRSKFPGQVPYLVELQSREVCGLLLSSPRSLASPSVTPPPSSSPHQSLSWACQFVYSRLHQIRTYLTIHSWRCYLSSGTLWFIPNFCLCILGSRCLYSLTTESVSGQDTDDQSEIPSITLSHRSYPHYETTAHLWQSWGWLLRFFGLLPLYWGLLHVCPRPCPN